MIDSMRVDQKNTEQNFVYNIRQISNQLEMDITLQKALGLHRQGKSLEQIQVYAVASGSRVQFSSFWDQNHVHYQLDNVASIPHCWTSKQANTGQWIQVCCQNPKIWTAIILQGRGDQTEWIRSIKISYTLNGKIWQFLENGKIFQANEEQHQKVRIDFKEPLRARVIRLHPQSWYGNISTRFDVVYLDL